MGTAIVTSPSTVVFSHGDSAEVTPWRTRGELHYDIIITTHLDVGGDLSRENICAGRVEPGLRHPTPKA
jgi:hypothetical protein